MPVRYFERVGRVVAARGRDHWAGLLCGNANVLAFGYSRKEVLTVDPRTALGLAGTVALVLVGLFRRRASDRRRDRDGSAFAGDAGGGGSCFSSDGGSCGSGADGGGGGGCDGGGGS